MWGGGGETELSSEEERVCSTTHLNLRISFLDKRCARKASTRESEGEATSSQHRTKDK